MLVTCFGRFNKFREKAQSLHAKTHLSFVEEKNKLRSMLFAYGIFVYSFNFFFFVNNNFIEKA